MAKMSVHCPANLLASREIAESAVDLPLPSQPVIFYGASRRQVTTPDGGK